MEDIYRQEIYPVRHFYYSYPSKQPIRRNFISIFDLTKPIGIFWHTNSENNIRVRTTEMVVLNKPSHSLELNKSKHFTEKNNRQVSKPKRYRGKKTRTKIKGLELKVKTTFKGQCIALEGYIFDLGPISLDNFIRTVKDLERYLWVTYKNRCQPAIMTETPATFSDPYIPTIIPYTGSKRPKTNE